MSDRHTLIGYARVSTADQTLDLQLDALKKADCSKIFTDTASGAKAERTGLHEALNYLRICTRNNPVHYVCPDI
jgi:DNA invertase Pin-like site-specific DNA recombinase